MTRFKLRRAQGFWALLIIDGEDEEVIAISDCPMQLFGLVADFNQNGVLA